MKYNPGTELVTLLLLVISIGHLDFAAARANFTGSPLILVPGDGGAQIWAKLNKSYVPHYLCYKQTNYFYELWLNLEGFFRPFGIDCFIDNMKLVYNTTTHKSSNNPGVTTMIPDFGNTSSVEYLDSSQRSFSVYFSAIADAAVKWGYTRGKDIRGAPFDFRKAPNELHDYFLNLTKLIEETYYSNGNKKVTVVAHSLGNPTMLYYFNTKPQIWKDKFIKAHVAIAPPWVGSLKIMLVYASGYNLGEYSIVLPPLKMREQQRTMPSSAFLLPSPAFWAGDEVLVQTPTRNYTTANFKTFFEDLKYPNGYSMYLDTKDLLSKFEPPGVEVHNLYGTGVPTPAKWIYGKGYFPDYQPKSVDEDGDGTVNIRSAVAAKQWIGKQKQAVFIREFRGLDHMGILRDVSTQLYLKNLVLN